MTTRKQLEAEYTAKQEQYSNRLKELEEQHKKFADEDAKQSELDVKYYKIQQEKDALYGKAFIGNWGNYHNYQYSQIPDIYKFNEDDRRVIIDALNRLWIDNQQKIKSSTEMAELDRQQEEISSNSAVSEEHNCIEREIEDVKRDISWCDQYIRRIATKGGLIEICKGIKEQQQRDLENQKRDALFQKYIAKILEVNVKIAEGEQK